MKKHIITAVIIAAMMITSCAGKGEADGTADAEIPQGTEAAVSEPSSDEASNEKSEAVEAAAADEASEGEVPEAVAGDEASDAADAGAAPVVNSSIPVLGEFPEFTASTLDGQTLSDDVFADYDLTVLNFWATWCPPCVGEIPELASWAGELPSNVNLMGVILDVGSLSGSDDQYKDTALKIMSDAGASYPVIKLDDDNLASLAAGIYSIPTTLFIDRQGNVIDRTIIGAMPDKYREVVEEYLSGN